MGRNSYAPTSPTNERQSDVRRRPKNRRRYLAGAAKFVVVIFRQLILFPPPSLFLSFSRVSHPRCREIRARAGKSSQRIRPRDCNINVLHCFEYLLDKIYKVILFPSSLGARRPPITGRFFSPPPAIKRISLLFFARNARPHGSSRIVFIKIPAMRHENGSILESTRKYAEADDATYGLSRPKSSRTHTSGSSSRACRNFIFIGSHHRFSFPSLSLSLFRPSFPVTIRI